MVRMGLKEKEFSKIKFAIIDPSFYSQPTYIEDDDEVIYDVMVRDSSSLGLDHPDKTPRPAKYGERAIVIK